ncbi:MAG: hypothetical protein AAF961_08935, partial [Planctomycetota bacterium]
VDMDDDDSDDDFLFGPDDEEAADGDEPGDQADKGAGDEGDAAADETTPTNSDGDAAKEQDTPEGAEASSDTEPSGEPAPDSSDGSTPEASSTDSEQNVEADAAAANSPSVEEEAAPSDDKGDSEVDRQDDDQPSTGGESSSRVKASAFRLVNFQQEEAAGASVDEPRDDSEEAATGADGDTTSVDGGPQQDPSAEAEADQTPSEQDAAEGPADDESTAGDEDAATTNGDPQEGGPEEGGPQEGGPEEEVRYVPLDDVQDSIRDRLAEDKAIEALEVRMNEAMFELQTAYATYGAMATEALEQGEPLPQPPPALADLKPIAEKYGLSTDETGLFTQRELADETIVGRAYDPQTRRGYVADVAFGSLELYEPYLARELAGDWYLVLKTKDIPYKVPTFEEVKKKVQVAWKLREAAGLAEEKVKELAAEATQSEESFTKFFEEKGYRVIEKTDMFSWLTFGLAGPTGGQQPMVSMVPDLENIGPQFMATAFELQDDQTAGVLNFDQSEAMVIKVHSRELSRDDLQKLFLATESYSRESRVAMMRQRQRTFANVLEQQLIERTNLDLSEWERSRLERLANQL